MFKVNKELEQLLYLFYLQKQSQTLCTRSVTLKGQKCFKKGQFQGRLQDNQITYYKIKGFFTINY